MKISQIFFKQHIGWYFKKHWIVQGRKIPYDTDAEKILKNKGIPIYKPEDILKEKRQIERVEVVGLKPKPVLLDNTHPDWHERICYTYRDNNVLLEGLDQAKVITKTVEIRSFPESYKFENLSKDIHNKVKKIILNCHVFDAEQKKLPKIKDPERPAWNFPRVYGITEERVNKLIVLKLLQLIEFLSKPNSVKQKAILNNLQFSFPFEKCGDLIQLKLRGDTVLLSSKPLSPLLKSTMESFELPNIFPIKHTVTLNEENIYQIQNIYPVNLNLPKSHPHTVFVHYNQTEVQNLYEEEVTEPQILGRSLMKTFTVAAAYARQKYGENIKEIPTPVTVQCVHTDGRLFHFGVLQLNTLDLEEGGIKNVWYHVPRIPLFSSCCYKDGRPVLIDYNEEVIQHLITFYNST